MLDRDLLLRAAAHLADEAVRVLAESRALAQRPNARVRPADAHARGGPSVSPVTTLYNRAEKCRILARQLQKLVHEKEAD